LEAHAAESTRVQHNTPDKMTRLITSQVTTVKPFDYSIFFFSDGHQDFNPQLQPCLAAA